MAEAVGVVNVRAGGGPSEISLEERDRGLKEAEGCRVFFVVDLTGGKHCCCDDPSFYRKGVTLYEGDVA